jgi:hypothetical protein
MIDELSKSGIANGGSSLPQNMIRDLPVTFVTSSFGNMLLVID